jgi:hypothetical protein
MPAGTRWSAAVASLQHGIDALQETMKTSQQQQQENLAEPWRNSLQDGDMSCETVGLAGSIICFFLGQFFFGSEHCIGGNYVYAWNLQSLVVRQAWTIYEELDGKNDMLLSYALHVHMFMLRRT